MSDETHLQNRGKDAWEAATDEELVDALLRRPQFIDPRWMNWLQNNRPAALRRALLLHQDFGGVIGPPGQQYLDTGSTTGWEKRMRKKKHE